MYISTISRMFSHFFIIHIYFLLIQYIYIHNFHMEERGDEHGDAIEELK